MNPSRFIEDQRVRDYGKETIGDSGKHNPKKEVKPGYSWWIENGVYYQAPTVDRKLYGGHAYDDGGYERGMNDCPCGCSMYSSSSSGPCDPFGACPENPNPFVADAIIDPKITTLGIDVVTKPNIGEFFDPVIPPPPPQVGFWRSARGENHGLNSQPGDEWAKEGDITDTDRLRWLVNNTSEEMMYECPSDIHEARAWIDTYLIPALAGSNGAGQA